MLMDSFTQWEAFWLRTWVEWGQSQAWLDSVALIAGSILLIASLAATAAGPVRWPLILGRLACLIVLVGLAMTLASVLKEQIARPRPPTAALLPGKREGSAYGMPSAHAVLYGIAAGVIAASWPMLTLRISVAAMAFLIAFVRVAKGLHYPSDVLAGWALGLTLGLIGSLGIKKIR